MTSKYGNTIVLDFKIHNNTGAAIPDYNFIFNWNDVSNAIMWSGLDVIQNGDNGIVELRKTTWGADLAVGTTVYSLTLNYTPGMFPPDEGTLNGQRIQGITCYTPPAHENFTCEKDFTDVCMVRPSGPGAHEIKIGEGSAFAWNAPLQMYIPENRKGWAIGMAVSHTLFTNLIGFDVMSINEYFATAIQESSAGCEGSQLVAPNWVTKTYPHHDTDRPIFCYDPSGAVAVGYFQQEMGGSWTEMNMNYPCFIPKVDRNEFIATPSVGSNFEFQSIVKAYHDYRNVAYWQYVKCWNPVEFFKTSNDPYAAVKVIGMAYNQGMNHSSFEEIFTTNRAAAVGAANLMDHITPGTPNATNRLYAEQINRLTKVLDDRVADISWTDAAVFGITDRAAHNFRGFYDAQFEWSDVEDYIKKIMPFYAQFGVVESDFIAAIKPVFNSVNNGNSISFRYQMDPVIEAIVIYLPAFDPKKGLADVYGGSGANNCFAPTARMEGFDAGCGENLMLKVYFSGDAPYTFTYKKVDETPEITYPEITTSDNPYTIITKEEGTYILTAIRDNVSVGEAICKPIELKYIVPQASAKLVKYGESPCLGILAGIEIEIDTKEPVPYTIEYEFNGVLQSPVTINSSKEILVPSPAPEGIYRLTKISVKGCDTILDETLVIDPLPAAPIMDVTVEKYGEDPCLGIGAGVLVRIQTNELAPYTLEYEIDGVAQTPVTIYSSPFSLASPSAPEGTYTLTKIIASGCETVLNETVTIVPPPVAPVIDAKLKPFGEDFCLGTGSGIELEIITTETGPFEVEYEIDGVLQSPVTVNSSPYILVAAPAAEGTYTITKITVSGCDVTLNEILIIGPPPVAPITTAALTKYGESPCLGIGAGVQLEINSSETGPFEVEYEIDGVPQTPVTVSSSPYILATAPAKDGTYTVTKITVSGCDTILNESLIIDPLPAAPIMDVTVEKYGEDLCLGIGAGVLVRIQTNELAPYILEYEIDGVAQTPVTIFSSPFSLASPSAPEGTYTLTKIAASGCETILNESITINPAPVAPVVTASLSKYGEDACLGIGAGITLEITGNQTAPFEVEYEIDGVLQPAVIVNSSPYTLVASPAAEGTYTVRKITVSGCETILNETVIIDPIPIAPVVTASLSKYGEDLCLGIGAGIALEITGNQTAPFEVEYEKDGVLQPAVIVNSSPYTLVASPAAEGSYTVTKITVSGCETTFNETVIINPAPIAPVVTASLTKYGEDTCLGIGAGITLEITGNQTAPFEVEYEKDGVLQPAVIVNSSPYTLVASPAAEGTYTVTKITVSGCETALNETVIIDPAPVAPVVTASLSKYGEDACLGIGVGIILEITGNQTAPFEVEYEKDGVLQPAVIVNSSPYTLVASPAAEGSYTITKITVSGCEITFNETVIIDPAPIAPIVTASLSKYGEDVCLGIGAGIALEITGNQTAPFEVEYEKDGVLQPAVIVNSSPYTLLASPAAEGTYTVTKITVSGCETILNETITIDEIVLVSKVEIKGNLFFCEEFTTTLEAVVDPAKAEVDSYQWIKDNVNVPNAYDKTYEAGEAGEYEVMVIDKYGCVTISPIVKVIERCGGGNPDPDPDPDPDPIADEFDYLKFFTPNDDGYNDTWHIKNISKYRGAEIKIFDRYGKFIILLTQNTPGWDGTFNNRPLFSTDYWFVMTYDDKDNPSVRKTFRGHFSLKR